MQEMVEIICGDCLEEMGRFADNLFDAVITDPPYFLPAAHYSVRRKSYKSLSDLSILEHFFRDVFREIGRILKRDGFVYAFCNGQSYPVFYAVAYEGFKRVRPLIWDKMTSINGYGWRHQHEIIMFGEMPDSPAVKTGDGDILRYRAVPLNSRVHLAEKPIPLLRKLIEKTTPANGLILDPFAGSGTTGIAAKQKGHRAVLIERDNRFCGIARKRLEETEGNVTLSLLSGR